MAKLTPKQERFVQEYLIDLNATAAARRSGYKWPDKIGPRLVGESRIAAAITAAQQGRSERTQIDQDYVVQRLVTEAEREGEDASHAARVKALELLGRHVGMWPEATPPAPPTPGVGPASESDR
jgi:phage terminase small subunit